MILRIMLSQWMRSLNPAPAMRTVYILCHMTAHRAKLLPSRNSNRIHSNGGGNGSDSEGDGSSLERRRKFSAARVKPHLYRDRSKRLGKFSSFRTSFSIGSDDEIGTLSRSKDDDVSGLKADILNEEGEDPKKRNILKSLRRPGKVRFIYLQNFRWLLKKYARGFLTL